jgi:hypothetical protein
MEGTELVETGEKRGENTHKFLSSVFDRAFGVAR